MFEFFVFSLLFEALWLLASGGFFRYNQDGGHRGRKASVASEKIRNTQFGTNRGRLPDFFMQPSRRRSLAGVTARRYFVAKNQRTRKPQVIRRNRTPHAHAQGVPVFDSKEIVLSRADYSALLLAASSESLRKRLRSGSSSREARRARSPAALLPLSSWEQASFWNVNVSFSI